MSYSIVGIVNLALRRVGVARIVSLIAKTPQAIDADACWEYIRDIVLQTKDWKFAKRRYKCPQSVITPQYNWDYAYGLPEGFLRLCREDKDDSPVYPAGYPYKFETLSDGNLYILSDYNNANDDFYITYILKITDPEKYFPAFIDALAWRLAAELAIPRTEGKEKFKWCIDMYKISLTMAEEVNQCLDYLEDETGSTEWEDAGRG